MSTDTEPTTEETSADGTPAGEEVAAAAQGARDTENHPLVVEDLRKTFGGITAVDGASFSVAEGSLTGLIGPNGAGKSTTFNCITGVHTPTSGSVRFRGNDITGMAPHEIARQGLVRTFQIARELPDMTVLENMMLAPQAQSGERLSYSLLPGLRDQVVAQEEELLDRAWQQLEFFEIDHLAEEYAGTLSGGQRKLLEMARALMTDPDMVLLDEPLAGVNPTLEEKLLDRIHELREMGNTFLFVEHDMDVIMDNCEHVIVMHQGQVLAEGTPEQVTSDDRVVEAYLGGDV